MLGEMHCNTGGSQRTEQAEALWHRESQRGRYERATEGLQGHNLTIQTELHAHKVSHSA